MTLTKHRLRMMAARSSLLLDNPFFGVLALGLILVEDAAAPTMYTNGRVLGYSPKYIDTLTDTQLQGAIAHECMHCALGHPWRRDARKHGKWNRAGDYALNGILDSARIELPPNVLLDHQYDGKSSEWIYDRLQDDPSDDANGGCGADCCRDAPDGLDDDGQPMPTESDWQQAYRSALTQSTQRGTLPGDLARQLDEMAKAKVDWRSILRRFVQQVTRADYSWARPNRRYLASKLYLPALHSIQCGKIAVAIDTSGSIDRVMLDQFAAEIRSIAAEVKPSSVDLLWCDADLHRVDTFEDVNAIEFSPVGGGGTDFCPVFAHYEQPDVEQPQCLVYLTDLYGSFPDTPPDYPVIWCSTSTQIAPFGETVPCLN